MTSSPIVARWELSRRLATRRRDLDMSVATITDELGFTRNYWSAVENDRTLIAEDKLHQLFDVLQFEEPDRTELLELREASRQKGWWDDYSRAVGPDDRRFYGLEYGTIKIRTFVNNLIPGVLQTADYARAIIQANPAVSELQVEELVSLRVRRQNHLLSKDDLNLVALLGEAALRQQLDGPGVQIHQLTHLLELQERLGPRLQIRVLPFSTSPGLIAGSASLLFFEYQSRHLPQLAYQEAGPVLNHIESGEADYRSLRYSWEEALGRALNTEDSAQLARNIIDFLS